MTSLRQRMIEDMQIRNLSVHTQATYKLQVSLFARYFNKSPELLGPDEIRAYQIYLTNERKLATSSILIAISALRFLYKVTLKKDWRFDDIIPAPKKPQCQFSFRSDPFFSSRIDPLGAKKTELSHGGVLLSGIGWSAEGRGF
jgi:site-specific recombinase XerD